MVYLSVYQPAWQVEGRLGRAIASELITCFEEVALEWGLKGGVGFFFSVVYFENLFDCDGLLQIAYPSYNNNC